jgi:hypothetical protein
VGRQLLFGPQDVPKQCSVHSCEGTTGGVGKAQLGLYSSPWVPLDLGRKSKLKNTSVSFIMCVVLCDVVV